MIGIFGAVPKAAELAKVPKDSAVWLRPPMSFLEQVGLDGARLRAGLTPEPHTPAARALRELHRRYSSLLESGDPAHGFAHCGLDNQWNLLK